MLTAMLIILCALGWFFNYVSAKALVLLFEKRGYNPPADEELKECTQEVLKKMLGLSNKI